MKKHSINKTYSLQKVNGSLQGKLSVDKKSHRKSRKKDIILVVISLLFAILIWLLGNGNADKTKDYSVRLDAIGLDHLQSATGLTVFDEFPTERTVDDEDRVEIFFSCDSLMTSYWCAEIDPKARPMDYAAHFGQPFDYEWNFRTLQAQATLTEKGYRVDASVALSELRELGIDTKDFYMGVFRADFHPDGSVNWYSLVSTDDKSAYFHKPNVLFPATIRE